MRRVATLFVSAAAVVQGAWAPKPQVATLGAALPVAAETTIAQAFPCLGRQIDATDKPGTLIVLRGFDDGTVPAGQNGPLNDRGYLLGFAAVANLRSSKVMVTLEGDDAKAAQAALQGRTDVQKVTLDGAFTAYDQRTEEKTRGLDAFLFFAQANASRDYSYSALQFTGVLEANGMPLAGGSFRHKAVLNNVGTRYNVSVFRGDSDLGATFARASFQAVGDIEALLVDLTILSAITRLYDIDASACLNRPGGADYTSTSDALYDQSSRQQLDDRTIAALFRLGYLAHPTLDYSPSVSRALRQFQSRYGLPPDGLPNKPTFASLGRALIDGETRPNGVDLIDAQLGAALEAGHSGQTVSWSQGGAAGWVTIGQTWVNYQKLGRPCRAFSHEVRIDGKRLIQPERIACRLDAGVWATLS